MSCTAVFGTAIDKFYAPHEIYRRKYAGKFYHEHPHAARVAFVTANVAIGIIQPIIFPLEAAAGTLGIPFYALYRWHQKKGDAGDWMKAWAFSVVGVAVYLAFMAVSAFYLSLLNSAMIYVGAICVTITVHVYRACKDPNPLAPPQPNLLDPNQIESPNP